MTTITSTPALVGNGSALSSPALSSPQLPTTEPPSSVVPKSPFNETTSAGALSAAEHILARGALGDILVIGSSAEVLARAAQVTRICMDVDGTALLEGETALSERTLVAFERAAAAGISLCIGPTGKPMSEALSVINSVARRVPVDALIEKGAYRLRVSQSGEIAVSRLLISEQEERMMAELRSKFYPLTTDDTIAAQLEREFNIVIVPAGQGTHQAVISFDIQPANTTRDVLRLEPSVRRELKLYDPQILMAIRASLPALFAQYGFSAEQLRITDLGNGNLEISPLSVVKDRAVTAYLQEHRDPVCAVVGDSENDREMLSMGRTPAILSGLMLHTERAFPLVDTVDLCVKGEGRIADFIDFIVAAKHRGP